MTDPSDDSNSDHDSERDVLSSEDSTHPRIELLHHIATELAGCSTETAIYDAVITATYDLFDVRYAVIVIHNDDRWITITSSPPDTNMCVQQIPLTGSQLDAVIDRNETVVIDDVTETVDDTSVECGQALCTPIGEAGVLQLITDDDGFDEDDVHYLELLGWIVDARLDRLSLSDEVDSMEEQLYAFTDFQQDVLEQASHELRTPLTSILGYMEMLADEDVGSLSEQQKSLAQTVLRKATELDAALETLTSAFDGQVTEVRERDNHPSAGQPVVLGASDGPFLLLNMDEVIADPLAEHLRDIGYEITIAEDLATAREAICEDPPTAIVVDLFAAKGNGIVFAERLCREEDCEETTVVVTSILRDESTGMPQLGASAYLPEDSTVLINAAETLLGVKKEEEMDVLAVDTAAVNDSEYDLPQSWEVTVVNDLDRAHAARQENEYDLAIVCTDDLSGDEPVNEAVEALRERWQGRRLPVILVDRSQQGTEPRYTVGGKLFVQRPLNVANLASALISAPVHAVQDSTNNSHTEVADK